MRSLVPFAFLCVVLAALIMVAESNHQGPAMAPSPHAGHDHHDGHKTPASAPAPPPSAASFAACPQLIATALVAALAYVFWWRYVFLRLILFFSPSLICKFVSCFAFELNVMGALFPNRFLFKNISLLSNNEDVITNNEFAGCYFSVVILSNIMFIPKKKR